MYKHQPYPSSDAARTGKNADDNRQKLIKEAEQGLKDAVSKAPTPK